MITLLRLIAISCGAFLVIPVVFSTGPITLSQGIFGAIGVALIIVNAVGAFND